MERSVTVTFEGADARGRKFTITRTLNLIERGDNPRFFAAAFEKTAVEAAAEVRSATVGMFGDIPGLS